mmetsp:Transcript_7778/g.7345  ORF Transcript_7778/g.7345 Transcript_7778/m.7345 type:complete len:107 (+) Transcript_7778:341-661(+)
MSEDTSWTDNSNNTFMFGNNARKWDKCVLVIVNARLGLKKIPEESYGEIARLFDIPQMIGFMGGKGKFGLYFVGVQKDNLILLDPHYSQETVADRDNIETNRDTFR